MKHTLFVGIVALALAAPAAAQQTAKPKPATQPAAKSPAARSTVPAADSRFIVEAAKGGMAEVELGKVAADKASSPDVKKFAQRMVDDHGKANDELKTLAQNKNIALPTAITAKEKSEIDRMSKMTGEAFDRAYMMDMLADHRKDVAAFRSRSKSARDPDVKAWAAKTLPTLEDHLKQAQDINRSVVGTTGSKSSKVKPSSTKGKE